MRGNAAMPHSPFRPLPFPTIAPRCRRSYAILMARPSAHNSTLPLPIPFRGRTYASFMQLFRDVMPPPAVGKVTLAARLRRGVEKHSRYEDEWLDEALHLGAAAFQLKHGTRRTWILVDGKRADLASLDDATEGDRIDYSTFRQRVVKRPDLTMELVREAATLTFQDWNTHHGRGGRRKGLTYSGDLFPEARGDYTAVTSFLKRIGRYGDHAAIKPRLQRGWDIDDALCRPPIERDDAWCLVYTITQISTDRQYVGISARGERSRWREHLKCAFETEGTTPLYQAMRETGAADFRMEIIEEGNMSGEMLGERERHWIEKLDTMMPAGFNRAPGGGIGRVEGLQVTINGVTYQSRDAAARAISKITGLAKHVVLRRIVEGKPIFEKARRQSRHPEAGTILFRKWLGLLKRAHKGATAPMVAGWDDYDTWKRQTGAEGKEDLDLYRPDRSAPWGPSNFAWGSGLDRVTSIHGREITAFGESWPSKVEACKAFGIGVGTFNFRLDGGMTMEEALSQPLGKTSRRGETFLFEGERFRSITEAAKVLAKRHTVSSDKARDRIRRGIATARWVEMDAGR